MRTPNRFYILIGSILCIVLSPCSAVEAQPNKIPRIGLLSLANKPGVRDEAFKQGLRELGYVEGKNINIESRYTANFERLSGLAKELIGLKVDVLLASSILVAEQVKKANATIPIVVANAGNPIGSGLVASLAKPGGQCHRALPIFSGADRQTTGTLEGSCSQDCPLCVSYCHGCSGGQEHV